MNLNYTHYTVKASLLCDDSLQAVTKQASLTVSADVNFVPNP